MFQGENGCGKSTLIEAIVILYYYKLHKML
ncbi:MAG: hypothetical protein II508_04600 [Acholeplasmatales bacterium]|nr:hypothetical protein [Acholeplasmatales bacterium]